MIRTGGLLKNKIGNNLLIGNLVNLNENTFLEVFEGVPQIEISKTEVVGSNVIDLISEKSGFLKSKGEAKRELAGNSISINKPINTYKFIKTYRF
jgi:tyrosyl-tRNA synthetase